MVSIPRRQDPCAVPSQVCLQLHPEPGGERIRGFEQQRPQVEIRVKPAIKAAGAVVRVPRAGLCLSIETDELRTEREMQMVV
ncbi:hypothetical protein Ct61P_15259 [Colletotrichum tofieldiae]|nr:hypothetical protein Ct61P_15259 [Colletotrichum tofieldiae]